MITSIHNPKIQAVRKLQAQVKARRESKTFVIEGIRLAEEALQAGWVTGQIFYTQQLDQRGGRVVEKLSSQGVPAEQVSAPVMKSISSAETPQGLVMVLKQQELTIPPDPDFVLILDGIRDPGNLGTILRSAAAAGVQGVLLTHESVDAWSPKVLRAGMGAHFHLPIHSRSWDEVLQLWRGALNKLKVYLADASAGIAYTQADFIQPVALIIGGEASGAGREAYSLADEKVHIPMPGGSESLNAGIAASILLFEVLRQRGSQEQV